ncbi:MAG TPA: DUF4838 domain-containing protein [Candidatus Brocadiia bacterium]|nr:DUF4838 domain-containing protein [Candidatus Brocadiia bacterium]
MKAILRAVVILLIAGASAALAADAALVTDAGAAVIVTPDKADAKTRQAAELLRTYIGRSTGATLRIETESRAAGLTGPLLFVGRGQRVNNRLGARLDTLSPDGAVILAEDAAVLLAGRTPHADLEGAAEFLRRFCGVEWYMPGPLWEVVRTQRALVVPAGETVIEPSFKSRWRSGMTPPGSFGGEANWEWIRLQGSAPRYDFHHAAHRYFPGPKYGKEHPDWYCEIDGKRRIPGPGSPIGWQLCMTNPRVFDEFARIADEQFKDDVLSISVSPNDGGHFCQCPDCRKLWDADRDEHSQGTRLVFHMVNEVAKRVAKKHPDRLVGIMSYSLCRDPVPGLKVEPNVVLYLVGCRSVLGDPKRMAEEQARISQWRAAGVRHFGVYEWHHGSWFQVPVLYPHVLAQSLKFAAKNGADGWYSEDDPLWGFQGPAHWVMARLLWDINLDVDALLDQYCANLFGPAAKTMRAYWRRCEEQWVKHAAGGGMESPSQFAAYPPETRRELRAILDQAKKEAAGSEPEYTRVLFFSHAFSLSERVCAIHESGEAALAALEKGDMPSALVAIGRASDPDADPIRYMRLVTDERPGLCYYRSDMVDQGFLAGMRAVVQARIRIAGPAMTEAGKAATAKEPVSAASYDDALKAALTSRLPAVQTAQMGDAVASVKEYAGKVAFAPEVAQAPAVDGDLSDRAWANVPETTGFYAYGGGLPARYRTSFKFVTHGDRLYGAFTCWQNMTRLKLGGGRCATATCGLTTPSKSSSTGRTRRPRIGCK